MKEPPCEPEPENLEAAAEEDCRDERVAAHLSLVEAIARQLHRRLPPNVDVEALINSGVVGLLEALERYDPQRGVSFPVYARHRIYGEMIQCLRSLDWVSRSIRAWGRRFAAARARLTEQLCREATSEEMAQELELPLERYHKLNYQVGENGCTSLDDPSCSELDLIMDRSADGPELYRDPCHHVERGDLMDKLKQAVARLPERERVVVTLRHYHELKFREIGEGLGVTEARICQIYVQARKRLYDALMG